MKKLSRKNIFVAILIVLGLTAGGYYLVSHLKKNEQATTQNPNIILISVDTLRADHVGVYGYNRDTSPNIDNFAKKATVFENAFTPIPWTVASFASLFTGLYPMNHQVFTKKVDKNTPLLSEILKKDGYKTAGIISSNILSDANNNLGRGFDYYDEVDENDSKEDPNNTYKLFWDTGVVYSAQRSDRTTSEAKQWLSQNTNRGKFFLFLHYFNPHAFYLPPREFDDKFSASFPQSIKDKLGNVDGQNKAMNYEETLSKEETDFLMAQYDEEIAYTDNSLGDLFKAINSLNLDKNSIIILTADHGESFDHDYLNHSMRIYDSSIKVPLLYYDPLINKGDTVKDNVSLIDVLPTIVSRLGINQKISVDGLDLTRLINKTGSLARDYLYTMSLPNLKTAVSEQPNKVKFIGQLYGVITKNFRVIFNENSGQRENYDVSVDPKEEKSISSSEFTNIYESLILWLTKNKNIDSEKLQIQNDELYKSLRSLNYL